MQHFSQLWTIIKAFIPKLIGFVVIISIAIFAGWYWTSLQSQLSQAPSITVSFENANLAGVDFSETALSGADFRGADLQEAIFDHSELEEARFSSTADLPNWVQAGLDEHFIYRSELTAESIRTTNYHELSGALLKNMDLNGAYLVGFVIKNTNFSAAKLAHCNFLSSTLEASNLTDADLSHCIFRGTKFTDSVLTRVNPEEANFNSASDVPEWIKRGLDKNFYYAKSRLIDEILGFYRLAEGAYLVEADFSSIHLPRMRFRDANLSGAKFNKADLQEADFRGAILSEADFTGADVRRAQFLGARDLPAWIQAGLDEQGRFQTEVLAQSIAQGFRQLRGAFLLGADLSGNIFEKVDFTETNLSYIRADQTDFKESQLQGVNISYAVLKDARFIASDLLESVFFASQLEGALFQDCTGLPPWLQAGLDKDQYYRKEILGKSVLQGFKELAGADLVGLNFTGSTLDKVNFKRANLTAANFADSSIRESDFSEAILSHANFKQAHLQNINFNLALLNEANLQDTTVADSNWYKSFVEGASFQGTKIDSRWKRTLRGFSGKPQWD